MCVNELNCSRCNIIKEVSNFYICNTNKRGYHAYCKDCCRERKKEQYKIDPTKVLEYNKKYVSEHKDMKKRSDKLYSIKNKDTISENSRNYREKNKDKLRELAKIKLQNDPIAKFIHSVRVRQNRVLKGSHSTTKSLGCNSDDLYLHIESLFVDGMNWDNRWRIGLNPTLTWSIDHIIPLNKIKTASEEEIIKILHYTNLKPIWHIINLQKGDQ